MSALGTLTANTSPTSDSRANAMVPTKIRNDQKLNAPISFVALVNANTTTSRLSTEKNGTARTRTCFNPFNLLMNLARSNKAPQKSAYGNAVAITTADANSSASRVNSQMGKTLSP